MISNVTIFNIRLAVPLSSQPIEPILTIGFNLRRARVASRGRDEKLCGRALGELKRSVVYYQNHTMFSILTVLLSIGYAVAQSTTTSGLSPAASSAAVSASAAAATAVTTSETSNVGGSVFDNFYQVWLENTVESWCLQADLGL